MVIRWCVPLPGSSLTVIPSFAARYSATHNRALRVALPLPMLGLGSSTTSRTASSSTSPFFWRICSSSIGNSLQHHWSLIMDTIKWITFSEGAPALCVLTCAHYHIPHCKDSLTSQICRSKIVWRATPYQFAADAAHTGKGVTEIPTQRKSTDDKVALICQEFS